MAIQAGFEKLSKQNRAYLTGTESKLDTLTMMPPVAAYLMFRAVQKQEQILTEQRDMLESMTEQSKGMERQTTWLLPSPSSVRLCQSSGSA